MNLEDGIPSFTIEVDFLKGAKGDTGFSPRIEVASLTSAEYILRIINEDGEILTPNLKGDLSMDDYVLKEEGMGLSRNSFEDDEKQKLQELQNYDDTEIRENISKVETNLKEEIEEAQNSMQDNLNQSQQDLLDDMSKTYTGTNITAPTVEGYGRINKLYGHTIEEGTGEKSPTNPYTLRCVGDDVNLAEEVKMGLVTSNGSIISTTSNFIYTIAKVEPNTTYIISKNKGNRFQVYGTWDYPAPGVEIKETYLVKNEGSLKQITTLSTAKYLFIYLDNSGAIDIKVKIQKGSIATPYSPYNKGTVEIISQNGDEQSSNTVVTKPLCSLQDNEGNIVAQDWIDYSRGVVHRECGYIGSYNNESISTQYISSTGNLTAGATVVYKLATIVEEPIDCSNKIVQYSTQTTVSNRDGAKIEVSLTNNEAIAEVNGEFKNNEIQTITNENGTVIKFPNGMSICSFFGERATGSTYGDVIWNYPMPFKEAPVVLGLAGQGENYAVLQMMLNSPGTNMAVVQFLQNNSYYVSKKAKFSIVAIGRWK